MWPTMSRGRTSLGPRFREIPPHVSYQKTPHVQAKWCLLRDPTEEFYGDGSFLGKSSVFQDIPRFGGLTTSRIDFESLNIISDTVPFCAAPPR